MCCVGVVNVEASFKGAKRLVTAPKGADLKNKAVIFCSSRFRNSSESYFCRAILYVF